MRVYLPPVSWLMYVEASRSVSGWRCCSYSVADAFEEQADGRPLAPGVDRFLDLLFDDIEIDLLDGERLVGGGGALLLDHGAAALQGVLQAAVEFFGLRGERFPIVFEAADLVVGQERGEIGLGAVLADGGGDFAGGGGALLAQVVGLVQLGGELAQFLLVGHAAFLEQRFAAAAVADRGVGVLRPLRSAGLWPARGCSCRCSTRCMCW